MNETLLHMWLSNALYKTAAFVAWRDYIHQQECL